MLQFLASNSCPALPVSGVGAAPRHLGTTGRVITLDSLGSCMPEGQGGLVDSFLPFQWALKLTSVLPQFGNLVQVPRCFCCRA